MLSLYSAKGFKPTEVAATLIDVRDPSRLKMAEVLEAQKTIIAAARKLAAEGVISFGVGGGDDEYV